MGDPFPAFQLDPNLGRFFREVVEDTLEHHPQRPDPLVREYLLGLLEGAGCEPDILGRGVGRALGVQLLEAFEAHPAARFERLRQVGDSVLLIGGLYRGYLERSGLQDSYVITVGSRAYGAAAALLQRPSVRSSGETPVPDVLAELAHGFRDLMALLRDVALTIAARAARSATDLARLCELWLGERSAHLGRLLRARGVVLDAPLWIS